MKGFYKKLFGKEQTRNILKDKIIYLILSDRKNVNKR
jgi:hypothetical protein